jgi:hypothetical protein
LAGKRHWKSDGDVPALARRVDAAVVVCFAEEGWTPKNVELFCRSAMRVLLAGAPLDLVRYGERRQRRIIEELHRLPRTLSRRVNSTSSSGGYKYAGRHQNRLLFYQRTFYI